MAIGELKEALEHVLTIGARDDDAATGAVTTTDTLMAYVKQLITEAIAEEAVLGELDDAAAAGAVTDADTAMAYIKQLVTAVIADAAVQGALNDAAAAGAVTDADTLMAYIKQLVTGGIARDAVVGALDDAAAAGAVTDADTAIAYIKQLVTAELAALALRGTLTDTADDTTDTATMTGMLRQIAEAVNNGTGTAIGSNLSLVDLLGAFDGGGDPQGDVFQALGVGTSDSIADILAGAAGISTFPAAAAADDAVSLAEVLRYISEKQMSRIVQHEITFTDVGDGAVGAHDLFTVTGTVKARIVAICTTVTAIQAGATIEVGIAGATASIIAQTAGDAPDANEIWHDAAPDASIELDSVAAFNLITNGADIILTVGSDTVDSGVIMFYCEWIPVSSDGAVVAA